MRATAVIVAGLLLAGSWRAARAEGKGAGPADVSATLQGILDKHLVPGLIGAVVQGDQVIALGAAGVRKVGSPEPMTANDVVHLGSDTKAMTAVLIGQMVQAKQLSWETTLAEIFPELAPKMNPQMAKVTVAQVMHHLAGLPANADWSTLDALHKDMPTERRQMVQKVLAAPPATKPGTHFEYSNAGYVLLGAVLERKTGKPWETLIREKLFVPLEMKSAGFGPPGTLGKVDAPWGHVDNNGRLEPVQEDNPALMGPAGRVHCTVSDWGKFVAVFLDEKSAKKAGLQQATVQALITPGAPGPYAGGWGVVERSWGGTVMNHAGSNGMWYCVAWVAPAKHFAVLVATNAGGDDAAKACDDVSAALVQWWENNQPAATQ